MSLLKSLALVLFTALLSTSLTGCELSAPFAASDTADTAADDTAADDAETDDAVDDADDDATYGVRDPVVDEHDLGGADDEYADDGLASPEVDGGARDASVFQGSGSARLTASGAPTRISPDSSLWSDRPAPAAAR